MRATALADVRARDLRIGAAGMFGVAAVYPLLPGHPGFACPLRSLTGIPCPFCGMTRACVAAVHGHLAQSLAFNPFGVAVIVLAALVVIRPAFVLQRIPPPWVLFLILGVMWVWNIGFNPTFHQWLLPS